MSDFNMQQVKQKLEQDLKTARDLGDAYEKDAKAELKKILQFKGVDPDAMVSEKEEEEALAKLETELDEKLNAAVADFATKEAGE